MPGAAAAAVLAGAPIYRNSLPYQGVLRGQEKAPRSPSATCPDLAVLALATVDQLRLEDQSSDEVISGMFGATRVDPIRILKAE